MFERGKRKLIRQQFERCGLGRGWWTVAESAISACEQGLPLEPMPSGAGPVPARTVVALLDLEPLVEGGVPPWPTILSVVAMRMHDEEVQVDDALVRRLLATQMPELAD